MPTEHEQLQQFTTERTEQEQLQQFDTERTALLARHTKELADLDEKVGALQRSQMDALKRQASALGFTISIRGEKKSKKTAATRKPLTCRLCRNADLPGTGHTARTHLKWLETEASEEEKFPFR